MRELTTRITFIKHSLGNVKRPNDGRLFLPRSHTGSVIFLASWHHANMRFASQLFGRHQDEVKQILWDIAVDAAVRPDSWYRRYYQTESRKTRYALHESFVPGQSVSINCVVPATIPDEDFWQLMTIAGQYKGLSQARAGEYGHFTVASIRPRRVPVLPKDEIPVDKENGREDRLNLHVHNLR